MKRIPVRMRTTTSKPVPVTHLPANFDEWVAQLRLDPQRKTSVLNVSQVSAIKLEAERLGVDADQLLRDVAAALDKRK